MTIASPCFLEAFVPSSASIRLSNSILPRSSDAKRIAMFRFASFSRIVSGFLRVLATWRPYLRVNAAWRAAPAPWPNRANDSPACLLHTHPLPAPPVLAFARQRCGVQFRSHDSQSVVIPLAVRTPAILEPVAAPGEPASMPVALTTRRSSISVSRLAIVSLASL